jgi:hypothetical protein
MTMAVAVTERSAPFDRLVAPASPETNLVPRLGILCVEIDRHVVKLMPDLGRQSGWIIATKSPEGQAQFIDVQPGDDAFNNVPVVSLAAFADAVKELCTEDAVVLQIERDSHFHYVPFEIE